MRANPFIQVIRDNGFRNLWLGQIISQIALNMLSFVLAIKVYRETNSNAAVSLMLLSFAVPSVIFGVVAGSLVDYFDRNKILIFCNLSRVFLLFLFFLFSKNLIVLYFLSILISIVTQLFIPAEAPSIPNLVSGKLILTANSLFTVSFYFSSAAGYILAGPVVKILGYSDAYLFMSFLMLMASFFVYLVPKMSSSVQQNTGLPKPAFIIKTVKEGFGFINSNQRIKESLILMTFSQSLVTTLAVLAPGFADRVLTIDLNDASFLVLGPAALGLILGAFLVGQFGMKFLRGSIILTGILAIGFCMVSIASFSIGHLNWTIFFLILLGMFNSFVSVPSNTILQEESDNSIRGRVYGVLTSATGGISILPVIFSGILADVVGVGKTLLALGIIVLLIGCYQLLLRKRMI